MAGGKKSKQPAVSPVEASPDQVSLRLKDLRRGKDWTLEQLAAASGVSKSMLSQIERGNANPTLGVAFRIAQAFGITLGDLVEAPRGKAKIDVVRSDDRTALFRDEAGCRIRTLSPLHLEKDVEFYELRLKPGAILDSAPHFAGTREFLTIERGSVRLSAGDEITELGVGDSAHYPADIPHRIENLGRSDALAFLVDIYER